ncbi:MAG: VTT domain-containing protein [Planctomycetota bacterium]
MESRRKSQEEIQASGLRPRWLRVSLPLGVVFTALVLMLAGFEPSHASEWVRASEKWSLPAFVLMGAAMMSLFVPKTAVLIAAGVLFGPVTGSLLMVVTATLAATVNFGIGRWWLNDWIQGHPKPSIRLARVLAGEAGVGVHLLFRLAPIPTSVISYTMGAAGARLAPFLVAAAMGVVPQWLWVYSGASAQAAMTTERANANWIGLLVSIVAALGLAIVMPRYVTRRLDAWKRQMETD